MKVVKAYIEYIKDNPEGYWFKRKVVGWGWVPATRAGWLVILFFLAFVIGLAWRAEKTVVTGEEAFLKVILPMAAATLILIAICYKTGERPKWQWRIPKRYFKD